MNVNKATEKGIRHFEKAVKQSRVKKMDREEVRAIIETSLLSTEKVAEMLEVTKTRLQKIKELEVIIRGYYLKQDVIDYLNNEEIQIRRAKYQKKEVK